MSIDYLHVYTHTTLQGIASEAACVPTPFADSPHSWQSPRQKETTNEQTLNPFGINLLCSTDSATTQLSGTHPRLLQDNFGPRVRT